MNRCSTNCSRLEKPFDVVSRTSPRKKNTTCKSNFLINGGEIRQMWQIRIPQHLHFPMKAQLIHRVFRYWKCHSNCYFNECVNSQQNEIIGISFTCSHCYPIRFHMFLFVSQRVHFWPFLEIFRIFLCFALCWHMLSMECRCAKAHIFEFIAFYPSPVSQVTRKLFITVFRFISPLKTDKSRWLHILMTVFVSFRHSKIAKWW